ncbi:MAG: PKD domain-containing protein [Flavitalea sp.]
MKKFLVILIGLALAFSANAEHIKGGEMYYTYLGPGTAPNTSSYSITFKLFIDCSATSEGQLDPFVSLSIFNKTTNALYGGPVRAQFSNENFTRFNPASNPCIGNPPNDVCYRVREYNATVTLPNTPGGYTIAFQRCCRIDRIVNLRQPSNSDGATYYCEIPGTSVLTDAFKNSSPRFSPNDATAICRGSNFRLDFSVTDPDSDSIAYKLCSGFVGGSQADPVPEISTPPPFSELSYASGYSGAAPLGPNASINPFTGIITGIAPAGLGQYVITACAYEYRKGVLINIHRKDIHVRVSDCVPLQALLKPDYSFCDDFLVTFRNEQNNPPGAVYTWNFGDGTPEVSNSDMQGLVNHQYADTGSYTVRLKVVLAGQCIDSTSTIANVFPGFFPGFITQGSCLQTPIQFIDTTASRYGVANKWRWNFGDATSQADTSVIKNPTWKYSSLGAKDVQLIVESSRGCRDTITKQIEILDKPLIPLAFKDTLICSVDTLQLQASGPGTFSWTSSGSGILNENTPTPLVWPKTTTDYQVTVNEYGCINTASVRVRVVDFVTLDAGIDSTICLTDGGLLNPKGDGLKFIWSPAATLNDPNIKNPMATPTGTTTYSVIASIGKCSARDEVTITPIPYPQAFAGNDTTICFGSKANLKASMVASRFSWSPISSLDNPSILNPVASPFATTTYLLRVFDTLGCPKPGVSAVVVNVRDKILAFAGNDTAIVIGQPLQLTGTGAPAFQWTPSSGLSATNIYNPVARINDNITYVMRAFTEEGCEGFDTINVRVFRTQPDIFVPNAFNPAGTKNPVFRPVPVGISTLDYFRVFDRWGRMVFQTSQTGKGWDGNVAGKPQPAGAYVWMVSGRDYTGKTVSKSGTAVLIR